MKIKGRCEKIENRDKRNGFVTFIFDDFDSGKQIKVMGPIKDPREKEIYILNGEPDEFGIFKFWNSRRSVDCRAESVDILSSAGIGVSEKTANIIIDTFKNDDIFSYGEILGLSEKLTEIPGIGKKKAEAITSFIRKGIDQNKVFEYLSQNNVPYPSILSYIKEHGKDAIDEIKKDPYKLMDYDTGFRICDRIAIDNHTDPWSLDRLSAASKQFLKSITAGGNTRIDISSFISKTAEYSRPEADKRITIPEKLIEWQLYSDGRYKIYKDGDKTYLSPISLYSNESNIAEDLLRIIKNAPIPFTDPEEYIDIAERSIGITYNDEQRGIFEALSKNGMIIITGDPGTGKTTSISGIVKSISEKDPDKKILLCAPTGRAAARMSELSHITAKTMHKAMNMKWYNEKTSIIEPLDYDIVIADELSMCDTELFAAFCSAIKDGTSLILSGDPNQLPSVGPGQILRDLIKSGVIPVIKLEKMVRQKEESSIAINAKRIISGEMPFNAKDIVLKEVKNDDEILSIIDKMSFEKMPQILCPIKKTKAGTYAINKLIQEKAEFKDSGMYIDGTYYHVGDKIIMNNNNYDAGFMNGDVGTIISETDGYFKISFADKILTLDSSEVDGMGLAYALTVHKSQGAECDNLMIILPEQSYTMASRELLYTAVTRAKKKVAIVYVSGMLEKFVKNDKKNLRECGLIKSITDTFTA